MSNKTTNRLAHTAMVERKSWARKSSKGYGKKRAHRLARKADKALCRSN